MDIAQRMLPQDGSFHLQHQGEMWDVRVASQPTILGEKLVLRLLPGRPVKQHLTALGLDEQRADQLAGLLQRRQGLVLVTGPTGCGKTTTLYAALNTLDRRALNIMTLEDPVEYRLPDIVQTQVNYRGGLDFAAGLRGALRQDPDVMLVGEIRDSETAGISVRAALTGHLVLATLHTLDSRAAVARLLDMGCAPYQVAAALNGVLAQRLVRKPCGCGDGCQRCLASVTTAAPVYLNCCPPPQLSSGQFVGDNRCPLRPCRCWKIVGPRWRQALPMTNSTDSWRCRWRWKNEGSAALFQSVGGYAPGRLDAGNRLGAAGAGLSP